MTLILVKDKSLSIREEELNCNRVLKEASSNAMRNSENEVGPQFRKEVFYVPFDGYRLASGRDHDLG